MESMQQFHSINSAFKQLSNEETGQIQIEDELRLAVQRYLTPSDRLVYRFVSSENRNLWSNNYFVRRARTSLNRLDKGTADACILEHKIVSFRMTLLKTIWQSIKSKCNGSLPLFLVDAISDLRLLSSSFIEILIHRRLICKSHITIESEPSIYHCAIPILVPCLAILLRWDQEENDLSVTIYDRVKNQLEERTVIVNNDNNDIPNLDGIQSMSHGEHRDFVMKSLEMPNELLREWDYIPSSYHLWLMIIRYWYRKRGLERV